ncbi:MAG TPA: carbon monoxide dehydrogenase beta subunit family protein, partial [Methanospirillum sp.]|nr:carbon monoxide dehydrogenase beta subunit family protein [Methanospirillum sp.]
MPAQEAWIRSEMGGTRQALVITKPDVLISLIKKAKHPLIIIGHESLTDSSRTDVIIRLVSVLHESLNIPIICTSHIAGQLLSRGLDVSGVYGSMEILDRLRDPTWEGLDGNGQYDL